VEAWRHVELTNTNRSRTYPNQKSRGDCIDTTSKCSDAGEALSLGSGRLFDSSVEEPELDNTQQNGKVLPVTSQAYYPVLKEQRSFNLIQSGGYSEEATPVPIPNTEVKLFSADGSWGLPPVRVGRCQASEKRTAMM
jgi:hypothetical protein